MQNKPNQHYVWQKYLEPWTQSGQIHCLRNRHKIFQTNTRNVASQRYFYSISGLTKNDCEMIRKMFVEGHYLEPVLNGWLLPFERMLSFIEVIELRMGKKLDNVMQEELDKVLNNILEEAYCKIEDTGSIGLSKLLLGDLSSLTEDETIDFLTFISFQYLRTNKMKHNTKKSVEELDAIFSNFENAFNLQVLVLSTILGANIIDKYDNNELHLALLSNNSNKPFITSDQPVVNIHAALNQEITDFEIYYPLSPKRALLIGKNKPIDDDLADERIDYYNLLIANQSHEYVFANEENLLKTYMIQEIK